MLSFSPLFSNGWMTEIGLRNLYLFCHSAEQMTLTLYIVLDDTSAKKDLIEKPTVVYKRNSVNFGDLFY